jgi:hypothetical protein
LSRSKGYRMEDAPPPDEMQNAIHETREEKLADANMAIIFDFGHGLPAPDGALVSLRIGEFYLVLLSRRREPGFVIPTTWLVGLRPKKRLRADADHQWESDRSPPIAADPLGLRLRAARRSSA